MSDEKEEGFIFTPKVEEEGLIKEFPSLDTKIPEAAPEVPKIPEAAPEVPDLVKQNQEEPEKKELTEEEKRAKLVEAIKQAHIRYHPKKHFGAAYKQKRKAKNKMQKKSRKNSR